MRCLGVEMLVVGIEHWQPWLVALEESAELVMCPPSSISGQYFVTVGKRSYIRNSQKQRESRDCHALITHNVVLIPEGLSLRIVFESKGGESEMSRLCASVALDISYIALRISPCESAPLRAACQTR